LGEDERHGRSSACQEKGSTHARRAKEAFAANEGSLGGKKKSGRNEKGLGPEERRTYTCRSKKTLGVDEGALGSEKESRREIATGIATRSSSCSHHIEDPLGRE